MQRVAKQSGWLFFDAAPLTKTGEDGLHLVQSSHVFLAQEFSLMTIENRS